MLTTQEFADLCATSKKTVIHYDRIGLLKPAQRHGLHRRYLIKQVLTFQKIAMLKTFGLTLNQIRTNLKHNERLTALFSKRKSELSLQKTIIEKRLTKIEEFLSNLKNHRPMVMPNIKTIEPYSFYAIKRYGKYIDIRKLNQELAGIIGDTKFLYPYITVFNGTSYNPTGQEMIIGALPGKGELGAIEGTEIVNVPEYKAVSYTHVGPYSYLSYTWQFLNRYMKDNNLRYHPHLHVREIYYRGNLVEKIEDNCVTELQIPIIL
jgi:DNA-binding transcriptional MerR regulator